MIGITLNRRDMARIDGMLRDADRRVQRGEELFLLELAALLRREVQGADPKVPAGGKGKGRTYKYASKLRMATVEGMPRAEAAVAVWLKVAASELRAEDVMRTALIVRPKAAAPEYVRVLAQAGIWPADLLPFQVRAEQATVVARHVRPDEAQAPRQGIWARRREIAAQLTKAGAPPFELGKGNAAGQRVYVDIAWEVLRGEFGWDGAPARVVWRTALQKVMAHVPVALRKVGDYLLDGKETRFDTTEADTVAWRKVKRGMEFQKVLMPFVKKKV